MAMHKVRMIGSRFRTAEKASSLSQYQHAGLCVLFALICTLYSGIALSNQSVDSDGDGLPDAYEDSRAFLDPQNAADAALDQDGDGYTNHDEYVLNTNPASAASPGEVLLVDDDIPGFSALSSYTTVLDQLGVTYDVISADAVDVSAQLAVHRAYPNIYNKIIWFNGWFETGPDQAEETALAATLDAGKCLLISAQDYYAHSNYTNEVTAFMSSYLGVASMVGEVSTATVSGAGRFSGLGSDSLIYDWSDFSDAVTPDSTAFIGFIGTNGSAAIFKETEVYRTGFMAFPLEAIADVNDRAEIIEALLDYCETGHHDSDGDGTPDIDDPDDDNDGLPDSYEDSHAFLDPLNGSDAALDQDEDGLTNLQEYSAGSNPTKKDTDRDGLSDRYELDNNLDPTDGICPSWVCGGGKGWRHAILLIK